MCWYCEARERIRGTNQYSLEESYKCQSYLREASSNPSEPWPLYVPAAVEDLLAKLIGPNGRTIFAILEIRNKPE